MFKTLTSALAALCLFAGAFLFASPASAGDPVIEAAKDRGTVGEQIDGYLGFPAGSVDPATRRKVEEINTKRRQLYEQLAGDTGQSVVDVAKVTGLKQLERADPGEYVKDATGAWKRK